MTVNPGLTPLLYIQTGLLAMLWLLTPAASADCARDSRGEVYCGSGHCIYDSRGNIWCSRFYEGDAQITREGVVVCGKGQCARSFRGEVFCSSVVGGAVLKDQKGRVRCHGRCERASTAYCEHTLADRAG